MAVKSPKKSRSRKGSNKLVVVESPTKARTIGKILGSEYKITASMGHVRDLPKGKLGIDVDHEFTPTYSVPRDKSSTLKEIRQLGKSATSIYLATDPDREGEAISWHLAKALGWDLDSPALQRIVFHEITPGAIQEAFQHTRPLDLDLVNAQQARRILDRLVGYELSPLLWSKVQRGLSAGRVQSVALRQIVDREKEIQAFKPREYWTMEANLAKDARSFTALLHSVEGERRKIQLANEARVREIETHLEGARYAVTSVKTKERRRRPSPPFTTSTLQQEAGRKLRFNAKRTMRVAQQLYEGISLGKEGSAGLITYMRTDSTSLASSAIGEARKYIAETYGEKYLPKGARIYKTRSKGAQEAHEAIRPTNVYAEPARVKQYLSSEQARLYDLIWKRMVASQMSDALFDSTTVDVDARSATSDSRYAFRVEGSVMKFPGFRRLYMEDVDDQPAADDKEGQALPDVEENEPLRCLGIKPEQHFTQPPPRFTEATLVKALEERGIGRPSTYAPTLATVMDRDYVRKEKSRFVPTKLGVAVNGLLTAHFPDVMDVGFTARVEEELDEIAAGERAWVPVLREFYGPFNEAVTQAIENAERVPRSALDEETDVVCEKCERPMVIKSGRFGRFMSCSGFPECRNSKPLVNQVGVPCPECGGDMVERRGGKRGRTFYGCSNYPKCDFTTSRKPLPQPCPECSKLLIASGRNRAQCTSCDYRGPVPESETAEAAV
jgi:DNA topoisomerase-1